MGDVVGASIAVVDETSTTVATRTRSRTT